MEALFAHINLRTFTLIIILCENHNLSSCTLYMGSRKYQDGICEKWQHQKRGKYEMGGESPHREKTVVVRPCYDYEGGENIIYSVNGVKSERRQKRG